MAGPVRVYKNQYMCGTMWDVEHSLAMVLLNFKLKMAPKIKVYQLKNQ